MQDNNPSVLKVREFFSDNEYVEVDNLIKISKEIMIFNLKAGENPGVYFLHINLLKAIGQDNQRIEMSSVIDKYNAIEYNGEIHKIYDNEDPEFVDTLIEVFVENV